jgi:hypothetical protein
VSTGISKEKASLTVTEYSLPEMNGEDKRRETRNRGDGKWGIDERRGFQKQRSIERSGTEEGRK